MLISVVTESMSVINLIFLEMVKKNIVIKENMIKILL